MGGELHDPGWSVDIRGLMRAIRSGESAPATDEPPLRLPPILAPRLVWGYIIPALGALLWTLVVVAVFVMERSGRPNAGVWLFPVVMVVISVGVPVLVSLLYRWPTPDAGPEALLNRYRKRLMFSVLASAVLLGAGIYGAIFAIDAGYPLMALGDAVIWCVGSIWMAPTKWRVRRDIEQARLHRLDLAPVIWTAA